MQVDGWKYYNHAAIPTTAPHVMPNLKPVKDGSIWKIGGGTTLIARWPSDWDCGHETEWWYCIKDAPFDMSLLKSKRRYEINKGKKYFNVNRINPLIYKEELYRVTIAAYYGWPEKYKPKVYREAFYQQVEEWGKYDVFGGFGSETGELNGFALLIDYGSYVEFSVLRTEPKMEKMAINAAMVTGVLENYKDRFDGSFYINDGSRAIRHETAFQDYLEKYFGFRKSFCRLNVAYRRSFGIIVKLLYPLRKHIKAESGIGSQIAGILKMEEICRSF